jgi:tRNA(Ile)-lysidine synthase
MNKFVRNLLTEWRKLNLPFSDETIIVAVSGGADSVSLLIALHELKRRKKLDLNFIVAHFNHNLRGVESEKDAEFVKDLAEKLNFEFVLKVQDSKSKIQDQSGNLEQNARNARYEFLEEVIEKNNASVLLTAHTQNDQAETFLFNLIRGSGLDGLSGIKIKQRRKTKKKQEFWLVRPLLHWAKRQDTENFCLENKIEFRHDAMNDDLKYSRVKIRKEIIPLLKKINPKIIETLSATSLQLSEAANELKISTDLITEKLDLSRLKTLSKLMRIQVLRSWLKESRGHLKQLDLKHFEAIEYLIFSKKSGRIIELPDGEKVLKKDGKLFFEKSGVEKTSADN